MYFGSMSIVGENPKKDINEKQAIATKLSLVFAYCERKSAINQMINNSERKSMEWLLCHICIARHG